MRKWASAKHGEERSRSTPIVALLIVSVLLVAGLAWQAQRIAVIHLNTATTVLREYAMLVADEYARRATVEVGYRSYFLTLERLRGVDAGVPVPIVAQWFTFDAIQRQLDPAAALEDSVRSLVSRQLSQLSFANTEQPYAVVHLPDTTLVFSWDRQTQQGVGFVVAAAELSTVLRRAFEQTTLLPAGLASGKITNRYVSLEVSDPFGRVLFSTGAAFDPYLRIEKRLGSDYAGVLEDYRVAAAIDPVVSDSLVIGGLPRSRLPLLLLVFALTLGVLLTAVRLLRRERAVTKMRTDFVSEVSHELRTPLTQIRMFAETLLLDRVRSEDEKRRAIDVINREARRLIHMVENLLRFSDASAARFPLSMNCQRLAPLIEQVIDEFLPLAAKHGIGIESQFDTELTAAVDGDAIRQILLNLLDNAVKYGPDGQTVWVELKAHGEAVRLVVCDHGPGIPDADKDRIWSDYHRLERERDSAIAGAGIGLSVVAEIVAGHGGSTWVESAQDGGACFIVELPRSTPE